MKKAQLIILLMLLAAPFVFSQEEEKQEKIEKRKYFTKAIGAQAAPTIDGVMDEETWNTVQWEGDFIQRRPSEGEAPSQQTKFKIMYDDKYIYVGIRCYDTEPDKIVKRLSRRDGFEGDWVSITFDSYRDLNTAFSFNVTAAGVKGEEFVSGDGNNWDWSWNPIWYTQSTIDEEGWMAEMKIPFTQLRFNNSEEQIWGLQLSRKFFRNEERSTWQRIPLDAGGYVSLFGELHGLKNIKPKRQVEIQPYVVASVETYKKEDGNPYKDGVDPTFNAGIDGKIGVTNDLTLDFTINPDFGQVEADPAAITLDAFQIFFNEQRPFFVENKNIFDYPLSRSIAGNTFWSDNIFYSRRIGGSPSHYPGIENGEYIKQPTNTTILGAAKFSGKTKEGWSIGILESLTSKEYAKIDHEGDERKEIVEPLTNYFVSRISKDLNERNTNVGVIFTATNRKLEGDLDFLHKSAYSGGVDFTHRWKERSWYVAGNTVLSHVKGSKDAILNTQHSIGHLFQRVDADYLEVDTSSTSLTGMGGHLKLGKTGSGNWMFETGWAFRTPKLELNDIGFQRQADDIRHFTWVSRVWREPFSVFRRLQVNYNHWMVHDFGGNLNSISFNVNMNTNFKNNWSMGTGMNINPYQFSNTELRGGPRFRYMPGAGMWFWGSSDSRKKFRYGWNFYGDYAKNEAVKALYSSANVTYQPLNVLNISLRANYDKAIRQLQYVTENSYQGEARYISGTIDQTTLGISLRVNYTINPNLSIQYYGQPFVSRGRYSNFKYITNPTSNVWEDKFVEYDGQQLIQKENGFGIDENKDGLEDYTIYNPDFAFVQFRSNLVARWEYIPGSELFLVWSQGGVGGGDPQDRLTTSLNDQILKKKLQNIFLVKFTYRFIR